MSFNFGTPKTDAAAPAPFGNAAGGDAKAALGKSFTASNTSTPGGQSTGFGFQLTKPPVSFSAAPATNTTAGLNFNAPPATAATNFNFNSPKSTANTSFPASNALSVSFGTSAPTPAFSFSTPSTTPQTTTGFSLPTPATASTMLSFSLGSIPTASTAPTSTGFGLTAGAAKTTAPTLGFGLTTTTSASTGFSLGTAAPTTSSTAAPATTASLGTTLSTPSTTKTGIGLSFGTPTTTTSSLSFSLGAPTTTTAATATTTAASVLPSVGTLTFAQLEETINKWTIELDDQGKLFANQAKQLNAWDRLLISNGEKILQLHSGIERVKQQQQQLDQELYFVLAQQKELEDLIVPLEKELANVPVTDLDRSQTYQMAENMDSQLKQMTEDLKEIIEQLNETNKAQELSNPITQIGKILNAHMDSLQWIDRNTTQVSNHLDKIVKLQNTNRKNHEQILQRTYD